MRILYHHRTQGEEPESIHIAAIVEALTRLGHQVRVVGPAPLTVRADGSQRPTLAGRVKRLAPRFLFELLQIAYNLTAGWRLRRAIREFRPDFIYERYALFGFAGVLAARQAGLPLILEVNTPYAHAWAEYYGLRLRALARRIERRTLCAADHVITVTEAQRAMLGSHGVPIERITVCHNAIDPEVFTPDRPDAPGVRERLGLRGTVIGFVGTMNRWQGVPGFVDVMREVFTRARDAMFLFVGDGEFRAELERCCEREGWRDRVVFTGRRPHHEVPSLMAAMDIAVLLNSNAYGSPMKIFEYYGMGKAVIAPAVGPVLEVLRDGETGLLVEPGRANQMAAHCLALLADPALRARLAASGRDYVVRHHTWETNARSILAIHASLTAGASGSRRRAPAAAGRSAG